MKTLVFGNPDFDSLQLRLDGVSTREQVIALSGELKVGSFFVQLRLGIAPAALEMFAREVRELDRTLRGTAKLESKNVQSEISWVVSATSLGHIVSAGRYTVEQNSLDFEFKTDQTRLAPLLKWLDSLLERYYRKAGPS